MIFGHSPVVVSRRARIAGADWSNARSWFGGAPRIDARKWPRDAKRRPLAFAAQFDLAELARAIGPSPLPRSGSLAFFIGGSGAGVVQFVPDAAMLPPAAPPADGPDLLDCGGSSEWRVDLDGRPLFPFWPADFTAIDVVPPESDDEDAIEAFDERQSAAVRRRLGKRQFNLGAPAAFPGPPMPDWWQIARHYADRMELIAANMPNRYDREQSSLDYAIKQVEAARPKSSAELKKAEAYVALCEKKIADLRRREPTFRTFAAELADFARDRDPWSIMSPADLDRLAAFWARNPEFADFHHNQGNFPLSYLKDEMLKSMPPTSAPAFSELPEPIREWLEAKRAPRPMWWLAAMHYARRLDEALRFGVASARKHRVDTIAALRKKKATLQPGDALAVFRRMLGPKSAEFEKFEGEISRIEGELESLTALEAGFRDFVAETGRWVDGRDPWRMMAPSDIADLDRRMKRAQDEFGAFARYHAPTRREDLETTTLIAMASAEDRGHSALPAEVRDHINRHCLLPPGGWHQMFGKGVEIQGDSCAMREEGYILLLQLTYDDMLHWSFGDCGAYQFWISPADLAAQNWSAVKLTFECH